MKARRGGCKWLKGERLARQLNYPFIPHSFPLNSKLDLRLRADDDRTTGDGRGPEKLANRRKGDANLIPGHYSKGVKGEVAKIKRA